MNILIETIVDEYMDEWVSDLLDKLKIEECVVVYGNMPRNVKKVQEGRVCTEYATCKIAYRDTTMAEYEVLKENHIPPVDDAILNKMTPYEDVIFWMLRRRLGREFSSIWRGYCEHIRVWNYLIDQFHIDVVMAVDVPHEGFDYIIYALCKIKGIYFIGCHAAHFVGYSFLFSDIYNQIPKFESYFKRLQNQYANLSKDDVILTNDIDSAYRFYFNKMNELTPWYMKGREIKQGDVLSKFRSYSVPFLRMIKLTLNRLQFLLKRLVVVGSLDLRIYESTMRYFNYKDVFREYEMLINFYKRNTTPVDYTKKYIYVALHMQPELTSSPLGGRYVDQILMVQMLAFCLPKEYVLYVKEHPVQIYIERTSYSFRSLQFYQELLAIPEVRLVPYEEDTYKLIKGACAVASLTGTAGFEAIIYNKIFLMFGYYITQYAPNVVPIRNIADCLAAMEKVQEYKPEEAETQKQIKIYFKALEKFIFKGWPYDEPMLDKVVSKNYWKEGKRNLTNAYLKKIIEFMGESVLRT